MCNYIAWAYLAGQAKGLNHKPAGRKKIILALKSKDIMVAENHGASRCLQAIRNPAPPMPSSG
jgi:hypothetical protein